MVYLMISHNTVCSAQALAQAQASLLGLVQGVCITLPTKKSLYQWFEKETTVVKQLYSLYLLCITVCQ